MQYVPFEEVVAESITAIGADGNDEIAKQFARQWIHRGMQSLGDSDERINVVTLYPKNLLIKKPKDYKQLVDIALHDSANNLLPHTFHTGKTRIYPKTDTILYTTTDESGNTVEEFYGPIDISEDQNNFVIGTSGGDAVHHMMLRYYQYPIGDDGLPLIREDEVEALSMYVRYRWSQRQNTNQSEIRDNRLEWQRAADQCKAAKKVSNNEQRKTIAKIFNRMISNFNRSKF